MIARLARRSVLPLLSACLVAGCSGNSSSSTATTPTTPSTPTGPTTQTMSSIVYPGDVITHSFVASAAGTVKVTLANASPPVVLGLGLGVPNPNAPGCSLNSAVNTAPGGDAQIQASVDQGVYCVQIFDVGNAVPTGVSYTISVFHP